MEGLEGLWRFRGSGLNGLGVVVVCCLLLSPLLSAARSAAWSVTSSAARFAARPAAPSTSLLLGLWLSPLLGL